MAGIVFVSTVGGVVAVAVAVVVAVRLLGLLWFAFADGVERASTTLRSILDQTVVGIPLSSSNSLAIVSCAKKTGRRQTANDEVGPKRRSRPCVVVGESVVEWVAEGGPCGCLLRRHETRLSGTSE
jgi:hypothetical protein